MTVLVAIDRGLTPNTDSPKHSRVLLAGSDADLSTGVQGLKSIPNCDVSDLVLVAIDVFLLKHVVLQLFKQIKRLTIFHPLNTVGALSDSIERLLTSYMVSHYKWVVKSGQLILLFLRCYRARYELEGP